MADKFAISMVIGATVSSAFHNAFKGSIATISEMGKAIKTLEGQSKNIATFRDLKAGVQSAETKWKDATAAVARLAREIKATEAPTKAMQKDFEAAQKAAAKAKDAFEKQRLKLHDLRGEMAKAGQSTRGMAEQNKRLGATLDTLRAKYQALAATRNATQANLERRSALRGQMFDAVALGAAFAAPVKAAIDFESAMADVRKVVDFPEPDGLAKFGATIKRMSRDIPLTADGLASIAAAGGQLGIKAPDLPGFVDNVAKMSVAFDMLPDEAGDAMAKLSNVYQLPISEMGKLGDAINHLSDNTAAKARDIIPVLARVGGTAKQFGLSAVQVAALGDAFVALGKPPEVAGTAINAMLTKLQTATRQGSKFQSALEEIGLSAEGMEAAIAENGQAALTGFLEQLAQIDKGERAGLLTDLFGQEYSDDISLLAGSLDEYRKALALVGDETSYVGSMQREFENRAETTENQLALLRNSLFEIGIGVGYTVLPTLNALVSVVRTGATALADFADAHPIVTKAVTGLAMGLIAAKVAAIGLGYGWTFVKGAWLQAKTVFQGVSAAMTLARVKLLEYGGAKKILSAIQTKALAVRARIVSANKALGTSFSGLKARIVAAGTALRSFSAAEAWTGLKTRLVAMGTGIKAFSTSLWTMTRTAVPAALGGIKSLSLALVSTPLGWVALAIAGAALLILKYWQPIKAFFSGLWQGIVSGLSPVIEAFRPLFPLFSAIGSAVKTLFSWFSQLFAPVQATAETLEGATSAGVRFGQMVGKALSGLLLPLTATVKAIGWIGEKLGLTGDDKKPALGKAIAATAATAVIATAPVSPAVGAGRADMPQAKPPAVIATSTDPWPDAARPGSSGAGQTTINAPITVHAAPGMDERAVGREVARALDERERQAQARRRGALHD